MVAPKVESIFDPKMYYGRQGQLIRLSCPECVSVLGSVLRLETLKDYPNLDEAPALVKDSGPLGFVLRCDQCGFRVEMHGDRLPTVKMLEQEKEKKPLFLFVDNRCSRGECKELGVYRMIGTCANCKQEDIVILNTSTHPAELVKCPVCKMDKVYQKRLATPEEAPNG